MLDFLTQGSCHPGILQEIFLIIYRLEWLNRTLKIISTVGLSWGFFCFACSTPANKITVPAGLGHEHCEHVSQMTVINSHEKNLLFYKSHHHTTLRGSVTSRKAVFTASLVNPHLPVCCPPHRQGLPSTLIAMCVHAWSCLTLRPHGLQPSRFLCPRYFPDKNTGVGCHFLLQGSSRPRG